MGTNPKPIRDNDEQLDFLDFTIRKLARNGWAQEPSRHDVNCYAKRHSDMLAALNPWAGRKWARRVGTALDELAGASDLSFVTLLHPDWEFAVSDEEIPSIPNLVKSMKADFKRIASLQSCLMFVDVTFLRMGGAEQRLCFHLHGLAWGQRDEVDRAMGHWPESTSGAPGKTSKRIYNLPRLLEYCAKDTRTRSVVKRTENRNWHHKERLWSPQAKVLIQSLGEISKPELTFATGQGRHVLRLARQLASERGWKTK